MLREDFLPESMDILHLICRDLSHVSNTAVFANMWRFCSSFPAFTIHRAFVIFSGPAAGQQEPFLRMNLPLRLTSGQEAMLSRRQAKRPEAFLTMLRGYTALCTVRRDFAAGQR